MLEVDEVVALLQVLEGGERQGLLRAPPPARQGPGSEDLRLRDQGEAERFDPEAGGEAAGPEGDAPGLGQVPREARPQVVVPKDLLQAPPLRLAARHEGDPLP